MTDVFPHTVWVRFERGKESVVSPSFKVGDLDGVQVLNLSGWSGRGGEQIEQTFRQLIPRRVAAPSESERNTEQIRVTPSGQISSRRRPCTCQKNRLDRFKLAAARGRKQHASFGEY